LRRRNKPITWIFMKHLRSITHQCSIALKQFSVTWSPLWNFIAYLFRLTLWHLRERPSWGCEILCCGRVTKDNLRHYSGRNPCFPDAIEGSREALLVWVPIDLHQSRKPLTKPAEMLHFSLKVGDAFCYKAQNICSNTSPESGDCLLGSTWGIPLKGTMNLKILLT
jgi:hypothetical protein